MIEYLELAAKFAPLATSFIALIAAIIALIAIFVQRDVARRRAAIDFFLKTELDQPTIELYYKFKAAIPTMKDHLSASNLKETIEYKDARAFLNVCELIAVGINRGAFSEKVSLAYWGDVIPSCFNEAKPLIDFIRKNEGSSLTYIDLEVLCERWMRLDAPKESCRWWSAPG